MEVLIDWATVLVQMLMINKMVGRDWLAVDNKNKPRGCGNVFLLLL